MTISTLIIEYKVGNIAFSLLLVSLAFVQEIPKFRNARPFQKYYVKFTKKNYLCIGHIKRADKINWTETDCCSDFHNGIKRRRSRHGAHQVGLELGRVFFRVEILNKKFAAILSPDRPNSLKFSQLVV